MYEMETLQRKNGQPYLKKKMVCEDEKFANSAKEVWKILNTCFSLGKQTEEKVYMLALNTKCKVIGAFEISHGCLDGSYANPREIFMKALLCNAYGIIITHNHPSGDTTPSDEDKQNFENLKRAGKIIGIEVLDSIIISRSEYYSLASEC